MRHKGFDFESHTQLDHRISLITRRSQVQILPPLRRRPIRTCAEGFSRVRLRQNRSCQTCVKHWPRIAEVYGFDRFVDDSSFVGEVVSFDAQKMPDVSGKELIHLQCHIGPDTLGLARLGAEAKGVDFWMESIEAARRLSAECGLIVDFDS